MGTRKGLGVGLKSRDLGFRYRVDSLSLCVELGLRAYVGIISIYIDLYIYIYIYMFVICRIVSNPNSKSWTITS